MEHWCYIDRTIKVYEYTHIIVSKNKLSEWANLMMALIIKSGLHKNEVSEWWVNKGQQRIPVKQQSTADETTAQVPIL